MPGQRNMVGRQYRHSQFGIVTVKEQPNYDAGGPRNVLIETITGYQCVVPQRSLRRIQKPGEKMREEKPIIAATIGQKTVGHKIGVEGLKIPVGKVYLVTFEWYGKLVGALEMRGKKLYFHGNAHKSAKLFFDSVKGIVEMYINQRLKKTRRR